MLTSCVLYLEKTALSHPTKIAIRDEKKEITFSELRRFALSVSKYIPSDLRNQPVGVFLPKSVDAVVAFMGVLYSGNFYAPMDVKSPDARLRALLNSLGPATVVTNEELAPRLRAIAEGLPVQLIVLSSPGTDGGASENNFDPLARVMSVTDLDPIYCIFTSGSTGVPKGVVVSHRSVADYIEWIEECLKLDGSMILGNQSPFLFDVSVTDIYLSIKNASTMVIIPEHLFSFPHRLMEFVQAQRINFIVWVPSVLMNVANLDALADRQLPDLKVVAFAGEVMPNKHLNYWRRHLTQATFANLYGPTEATVISSYFIVEREFQDSESLPIGFPCRNSDLLILTTDNKLAAKGDEGELCVRGTKLALGYWNDSEKTSRAFIQNPLNPHFPERIYRTGDLVKKNDRGEIIYLGRKDTQIKHMGYRIELGEIESAALGIPSVAGACVLYDHIKKEIVLFYSSVHASSDDSLFRQQLLKLLPKYMLPSRIVRLEEMPQNSNGKVDRPKLMRDYIA
jgi:amino acid adenylation domain-containing protein